MGWWGFGIMEGDTPCDVEIRFKEAFLGKSLTPDAAIKLINEINSDWGGSDGPFVIMAVGYLMMRYGGQFNDELRQMVLGAVNDELQSEECIIAWTKPDERKRKLEEFKEIVELYPDEGGRCQVPSQEGLFEKFAEYFAGNSGLLG